MLNILISTIDRGIEKLSLVLQPELPDVNYIISHQNRDEKHKSIPSALNRRDVIVSQIPGKGLSRNRNNALQLADGDIALIADDDVRYMPDSFKVIEDVFKNDPNLDVACFKIKTNDNEPEYKNYPNETYSLNKGKKHYISSIEIAFRVNRIKEEEIVFDERFGLGSDIFQSGEESVFINDCVERNLNVKFFPTYIVSHPYESSTKSSGLFDRHKIVVQGAVDARKTGWLSIARSFYLFIRLFHLLLIYRKNPFYYLIQRLRGVLFILISK